MGRLCKYMTTKEGLIVELISQGVLGEKEIESAFRAIDRKDFIPVEDEEFAYENNAFGIGYGQTISQPYTVAFMFDKLEPREGGRILDVGSGSGWTTALLAHIVGEEGIVVGVERIPELVEFGKNNLSKYDFPHASIQQATDKLGMPEKAPFDRILVSAVGKNIPEELINQLSVGGVLVMPVGSTIVRAKKISGTELETESHEGFVFVPLIEPENTP